MTYHPLLDSFAVVGLTAVVIGFTRATSPIRTACLPVLLGLTWHCLVNCPVQITRSSWASAVGGYTLSSLMHFVDVALLSGWSFDLQGPARDLIRGITAKPAATPAAHSARGESGFSARLRYGFAVFFSWRFVKTPYQVKHLPQLDPCLLSSRRRYLWHTTVTIAVCYLILDIMDSSSDAEVASKFYSPDKIGLFSRLGDITIEELFMRFFAAVGLCAGLVSFQRGVYSVVALVCVGSGLSASEDWPPFNGPILQAYSLRRFWSIFWHQINTHRLNTMSNYLLHDILRLQRGGPLVRYVRTWLIFLLSGVWHVAMDFSSGIAMEQSGALRFFSIQPLGIFIEDLILSRFHVVPGSRTKQTPALINRCIGFAWVCLWMAWTAPGYLYPIMDKSSSEDTGVVPVSVVGYMKYMGG
ncbi:hypothetical protein PFICI_01697 [Pestalotiopsis fici W106-1]|uniref:Wax synthase domain-containing protein n=1 Tax=Pestalotiopsis fici (strain W106-1 / CGMCC3.15140) TaxID=1229662 RepID=W3XPH1_PESFW|nr:uncharacterized protein PFICI_01697 [Pestalotiopsis fici W106-1]ETS87869.1 hypothetical protein PFICI_01697 [Pestalotiopsis fici W106-1]